MSLSSLMDHYLFVATLVVALGVSHGATERCPESRSTSLNLSVASRRNLTGHWIVSVVVLNEEPKRALQLRKPRQVSLDVGNGAHYCGDSETVRLVATATVSPTVPDPPAGYEVVNGLGHYKMHTAPVTWVEAREKCLQERAHLIVINSDQEADVVRTFSERNPKIVNATNTLDVHAGFHDRYVEGQYITVLGYPVSSSGYNRWLPTQPDGGYENCGAVRNDGKFHDIPCSWRLAYICEANDQ